MGGIDMADFGVRFFLCNGILCIIIALLLITKRALKNHLTSPAQFYLWLPLFGLLAVPFLPFRPAGFSQISLWLYGLKNTGGDTGTGTKTITGRTLSGVTAQIKDFALSAGREAPSRVGLILFGIWLTGILFMLFFLVRSHHRLSALKKSALPLQNRDIHILYRECLRRLDIKKDIPIYSTAFLRSPIIAGLLRPRIYLPIHLISDFHAQKEWDRECSKMPRGCFRETDLQFILLHELQHYRHRDTLTNYLMNLMVMLYWFNPLVWCARKEMRSDMEIACDTSVLKLLDPEEYRDYGSTLLNFAEKMSLIPIPFSAGISGSRKEMQKRILNISTYKKPSVWKKAKGFTAFGIIAVTLFGSAPMLSTYAADREHYLWNLSSEKISESDLSAHFKGYEGSFVMYDEKADTWRIYNMDNATLRTSPDSTYKIYDALFGLEKGVISPKDSLLLWDREIYPFEAWNADQDLSSAMQFSVNWYFQKIDRQLGASAIRNYMREIGYGNEDTGTDLSSYWMESSLKISPVEQVKLLTDLYHNRLGFLPENVEAVKDSICLFWAEDIRFYGKTGTGRIDGRDVNGWFVGFLEINDNTCFFATNIQGDTDASGSRASEITRAILSELNILK